MSEEQSPQTSPHGKTSVEAATQSPPNNLSSPMPPPVPVQNLPSVFQMGIGVSQNSLSPDAIRAYSHVFDPRIE